MDSTRDIVITGVGAAACLGLSADDLWANISPILPILPIATGTSARASMTALEQRPPIDKSGGQAPDLPENWLPGRPREVRYLRHVVEQALASAGPHGAPPERLGAVFGTTLHGMRAGGEFFRSGDPRRLRSFLAGAVLRDALDGLGVEGPTLTTCAACSSGLSSLALAATLLRAGAADVMLAGGYDTLSEYVYAGFDSLRVVAQGPLRPFAAARDGMKVAEGYGVLVLERQADALRRGAVLLATLAGFGESADCFHLTQPHPGGEGAAHAVRAALADAGLDPSGVGMIAAHATATPDNDAAEYAALASVFGSTLAEIPVTAMKSHLGHTLGGAGAVELVMSILALREKRVPATAGDEPTDPAFAGLNVVRGRPAALPRPTTANLALGFGGANTCVVLTDASAQRDRPAPAQDEAVITGIGLVLPGAVGLEELRARLRAGGAAPPGSIPDDRYAHLVNARRTRRMSEYTRLTLAAAAAACRDAGLEPGSPALAATAGLLGTMHGSTNFCEEYYGQIVREGMAAANPVLFAEGVPNAAAAHLSMTLGLHAGCQTVIGTRSAGLTALALAAMRICEGRWVRAIVGAGEEYSELVNRTYAACGLAHGREALDAGAGAVMLVVESRREAQRRGVRTLATIGEAAWARAPDPVATAGAVHSAGTTPIWTACDPAGPDRGTLDALGSDEVRTIRGPFPELFSAGPLAALVAGLLEGVGRFVVAAPEFCGPAVALGVTPEPGTDVVAPNR